MTISISLIQLVHSLYGMNAENKFLNTFRPICILESECILHFLRSHMAKHDSSEYSGDRSHHLAKKLFKNEIH